VIRVLGGDLVGVGREMEGLPLYAFRHTTGFFRLMGHRMSSMISECIVALLESTSGGMQVCQSTHELGEFSAGRSDLHAKL
jgi:hypothetical protein